jgi:hypothetical protein
MRIFIRVAAQTPAKVTQALAYACKPSRSHGPCLSPPKKKATEAGEAACPTIGVTGLALVAQVVSPADSGERCATTGVRDSESRRVGLRRIDGYLDKRWREVSV